MNTNEDLYNCEFECWHAICQLLVEIYKHGDLSKVEDVVADLEKLKSRVQGVALTLTR